MNWKLILSLSAFGLAMGVANVLGYTKKIELWLWLVIGIFCAVWIAKKVPAKHFLHGFMVGLIAATVAPLVQVAFFPTYISHYPEATGPEVQPPGGLGLRTFTLILAPMSGLISGVVLGLLAWVARKLLNKTSSAAAPSEEG